VVDVEQGALCPLEEDLLARLQAFPEEERRVGHVGLESIGVPGVLLDDLVGVDGQCVVDAASTFSRKILGSNRSWTRMPNRAYLSVYAGPIPFLVVPIWFLPRYRSMAASSLR
jgi:hypothetical protein